MGTGEQHGRDGSERPALRLLEPAPGLRPAGDAGRVAGDVPQPAAALTEAMRSHPAASGRRGLLLHISGDHAGRILFSRIARRWEGVRLLVVDRARAGLDLAAERRPDLLVVDAHLPDAGGEETVARLRRELSPDDAPIVVLGDDPSPSARARFVWAGANAYMTKPLDIAEIDRTVGELLEVAALR